MKTITTMLSKKTLDGDNLTVLVVKDANETEGAAAAAAVEENLPAVSKDITFPKKFISKSCEKFFLFSI